MNFVQVSYVKHLIFAASFVSKGGGCKRFRSGHVCIFLWCAVLCLEMGWLPVQRTLHMSRRFIVSDVISESKMPEGVIFDRRRTSCNNCLKNVNFHPLFFRTDTLCRNSDCLMSRVSQNVADSSSEATALCCEIRKGPQVPVLDIDWLWMPVRFQPCNMMSSLLPLLLLLVHGKNSALLIYARWSGDSRSKPWVKCQVVKLKCKHAGTCIKEHHLVLLKTVIRRNQINLFSSLDSKHPSNGRNLIVECLDVLHIHMNVTEILSHVL
jgi:hypothetical protein